jgi:hypothetical protein
MQKNTKCRICFQPLSLFGAATLLGKFEVSYYQCDTCGFVQTEQPYWLEQSYSEVVTNSDIGLISRNLAQADITPALINCFFDSDGKFIDYGGGYGLFVRLMRDQGFNFLRYDPFCENLFAKNFDVSLAEPSNIELVTAFEVFEHLVDPVDEMKKIAEISNTIFFSTLLLPESSPKPGTWWYYGLEHGQHISIYTEKTLAHIAERLGLRFYTNGLNYHLFTRKKVSHYMYSLISRRRVAQLYNQFARQKSLLASDYQCITGSKLN